MKQGDKFLTPVIDFTDTKSNIEALTSPVEGMRAITTDTHESGFYNGSAWVWGSGGGAVASIVAGTNIIVDATDPANPIISASGGGYTDAVEIDFGADNYTDKVFTITDARVSALSNITAQLRYVAPTGKSLDELEMDNFDFLCAPGAGTFDLRVVCLSGSVSGAFKINYSVG